MYQNRLQPDRMICKVKLRQRKIIHNILTKRFGFNRKPPFPEMSLSILLKHFSAIQKSRAEVRSPSSIPIFIKVTTNRNQLPRRTFHTMTWWNSTLMTIYLFLTIDLIDSKDNNRKSRNTSNKASKTLVNSNRVVEFWSRLEASILCQ